jgi:hypothetical protein
MTASADNIRQLRRMVAEPTEDTYTDTDLTACIERYPLMDTAGNDPDETDWTATYDLNSAASEIFTEKAACPSSKYDTADGNGMKQYRSQVTTNYLRMARFYGARRAIKGMLPEVRPRPITLDVYIGNQAEETDF